MLNAFIQNARRNRGHGLTSMFSHLGALGLFFLAMLDGSPLPTCGGPDILTAILAASHRNPWYEYAAVATAGSVVGALLTFRVARRAGSAYLHSKFGNRNVWSAALSQAKNDGDRLVCANVYGLCWSTRLLAMMECAALSSYLARQSWKTSSGYRF